MGLFSLTLSQLSYSGSCSMGALDWKVLLGKEKTHRCLSCPLSPDSSHKEVITGPLVLGFDTSWGIIKEVPISIRYKFLSSCPKSSVSRNLANRIIHSSERGELVLLPQISSGRKARKGPQRQANCGACACVLAHVCARSQSAC